MPFRDSLPRRRPSSPLTGLRQTRLFRLGLGQRDLLLDLLALLLGVLWMTIHGWLLDLGNRLRLQLARIRARNTSRAPMAPVFQGRGAMFPPHNPLIPPGGKALLQWLPLEVPLPRSREPKALPAGSRAKDPARI